MHLGTPSPYKLRFCVSQNPEFQVLSSRTDRKSVTAGRGSDDTMGYVSSAGLPVLFALAHAREEAFPQLLGWAPISPNKLEETIPALATSSGHEASCLCASASGYDLPAHGHTVVRMKDFWERRTQDLGSKDTRIRFPSQ